MQHIGRYDQTPAKRIDLVLVGLYLALVLFGVMNIYSSEHVMNGPFALTMGMRTTKQLIWLALSLFVGVFLVYVAKPKWFDTLSPVFYFVTEFLLVAVIFLGVEIKGSHSWFAVGPLRFQPAELAKIATSLLLATVMSYPTFSLRKPKDFFTVMGIIGLPMLSILLEKETGSCLVFVSLALMLYREGMSGWVLVVIGMFILLFILALVVPMWIPIVFVAVTLFIVWAVERKRVQRRNRFAFAAVMTGIMGVLAGYIYSVNYIFNNILADHQRTRIEVLLGIKDDPLGVGYNVTQSMIAIGSGGLLGKGYLNGTQNTLGFVPEQSTDFIFCTVGEEWGFLGCFVLMALFIGLIWRLIYTAEHAKMAFTRIYGYCVACIIFIHLVINIGMTIGLMPVIGIPLPFFSYGGSSLLGFSTMLMIYLALERSDKK